jgi:hypothetical protein
MKPRPRRRGGGRLGELEEGDRTDRERHLDVIAIELVERDSVLELHVTLCRKAE